MYEPQVNDYVKWTTALGTVHEGWVYFKCGYTPKKKGFHARLKKNLTRE